MDNYTQLAITNTIVKIVKEALGEIETVLEHMRTLSVRATADDLTTTERANIQEEIDLYTEEIDRIAITAEQKAAELKGIPLPEEGLNIIPRPGQPIH